VFLCWRRCVGLCAAEQGESEKPEVKGIPANLIRHLDVRRELIRFALASDLAFYQLDGISPDVEMT
jgi:hypothetical protein